jgi:2-polyprenyl-6-methoxyphenol hydroxylase-like FAD-dependent oxidoreductase
MKSRQAHVVGAGLAGLAVAACLAQRKWTVTVHERTSELREIGAGIGIKENSIRVMEELGCFEPILQRAHRIEHTFINDRPGHNLRETSYGPERVYTVRRRDLHREIAKAAESWGANIKLSSAVVSVNPDGRIATAEGEFGADLVIGADGLGSAVRIQSGLGGTARMMNSGSTRVLVPRKLNDLSDRSGEYWRGHNRVLLMPMSDNTLYVCASSREDDKRGTALPLDQAYWSARFPELSDVFARVALEGGTHFAHGAVRVRKWHAGRIAILGDAASGQPPNLGQGAGMAISNARALAEALERERNVELALVNWEQECMPFTHQVQNWSIGWEHFMHRWPLALEPLRSKIVLGIAKFPPTKRHWKNLYRGYKGS